MKKFKEELPLGLNCTQATKKQLKEGREASVSERYISSKEKNKSV